MAVGINAKIPHAAPEAVPGAAGDKGAEGEGFAQMLTGIVSSPVAAASPVPVAVAAPADKGGESDAVAQVLDIAASAPSADAPMQTVTTAAQVVAAAALQIVVPPEGLEGAVPGRSRPVPANPELPRCVVELGDLSSKLVNLGRLLGGKDPKAADEPDYDDDAKSDENSAPADDDTAAATLIAPLVGVAQTPIPTARGIAVAETISNPSTPAVKLQVAIKEGVIKEGVTMEGTAKEGVTKEDAAKDGVAKDGVPKEGAAKDGVAKVAIQLGAAKEEPAAKVQDLLKSLEPIKPFALPQQLRPLVQASIAFGASKDSPAGAAQAALAALNRSDSASTDAPAAAPLPSALPMFGASIQAMLQPQLAADTFAATAAPSADGTQGPDTTQLGIDRQLDIAHDNQWLDRLARDISRSAGQEGSLRFKLNPESLGTLHVEVAQSHAGTSVRLTADTEAARSIIADAQPRLIAEARAQGVRIAEAHVGMNSNGQHADQRRQDEARQEAFVRTARPADADGEQSPQSSTAAAERFA